MATTASAADLPFFVHEMLSARVRLNFNSFIASDDKERQRKPDPRSSKSDDYCTLILPGASRAAHTTTLLPGASCESFSDDFVFLFLSFQP